MTAAAAAVTVSLLAAGVTCAEPEPGAPKGTGLVASDLTCAFGARAAHIIAGWNCRRTADRAEATRKAQDLLDNMRI